MGIVKKFSHFWKGYTILGRIFWAITLTTSFFGMCIFFYYTFERYRSEPVSMTLETEYIHWNMSFPAVSICLVKGTFGVHLQSFVKNLKVPNSIKSNNRFLKIVYDCSFENPNMLDIDMLAKCDTLNTDYGISLEDLKEQVLPKDCNVFMDMISYNEKPYNCSEIFNFHKTNIGYCFIANSISDNGYSIRNLKLKYQLDSRNRVLSMRLKTFKVWNYGLHVHSGEELPFYTSISSEIFAAESKYSYSVNIIFTDDDAAKQSIRQRGCRFPNEQLYGSPFHYSFSTCMSYLQIQLELLECNCTLSTSPEIYRSHYCDLSGLECVLEGEINSKVKQLAMETNICVPSCIEQIVKFNGYSELNNNDDAFYKKASIEIIYLPYVLFKRTVTRSKLDLAVSVAGLAGLFFGASVLNFVEVLYYLVTVK